MRFFFRRFYFTRDGCSDGFSGGESDIELLQALKAKAKLLGSKYRWAKVGPPRLKTPIPRSNADSEILCIKAMHQPHQPGKNFSLMTLDFASQIREFVMKICIK